MIINFSDEPILNNNKTIFLAGPTLRNASFAESWRKYACEKLASLGYDGLVYVPEFKEGNMKPDLTEQASWERKGLLNSDIIIFYIPRKLPELPGFTTNIEFGMWISKKPEACMFCAPINGEKLEYLRWLWREELPKEPIYEELDDILAAAVDKLNNRQL